MVFLSSVALWRPQILDGNYSYQLGFSVCFSAVRFKRYACYLCLCNLKWKQ